MMRILLITALLTVQVGMALDLSVPQKPNLDTPQKSEFDVPGSSKDQRQWQNKQAEKQARKESKGMLSKRQLQHAQGNVGTQWSTLYSVADGIVKSNELDLPQQFRAIAEVRVPQNDSQRKNQLAELEYFDKQGVDTVLVVWQGEGIISVKNLVNSIKDDWNIIFAYGPHELYGTAYLDISIVRRLFSFIGNDIDALLPVWRLTSNPHYSRLDESGQYVDVFAQLAHETNPDLPILGEVFMDSEPMTAAPEGIAGAVLQNAGTIRAMEDVMLERANNEVDTAIIPAVVGGDYYYSPDDYSQQELWNMKTTCADNYIKAGARGAIIMVGNGHGSQGANKPALTETQWRKQK